MNNWIEHLQHPLVLTGFGLFVFATVGGSFIRNNKKLSEASSERLLHRGIILLLYLLLWLLSAVFL